MGFHPTTPIFKYTKKELLLLLLLHKNEKYNILFYFWFLQNLS